MRLTNCLLKSGWGYYHICIVVLEKRVMCDSGTFFLCRTFSYGSANFIILDNTYQKKYHDNNQYHVIDGSTSAFFYW